MSIKIRKSNHIKNYFNEWKIKYTKANSSEGRDITNGRKNAFIVDFPYIQMKQYASSCLVRMHMYVVRMLQHWRRISISFYLCQSFYGKIQ